MKEPKGKLSPQTVGTEGKQVSIPLCFAAVRMREGEWWGRGMYP